MSTATITPVTEYLETSYRPDCEYLEGVLLERNVGEWDHSRLQILLGGYLLSLEKELGILVVTEQRVQVQPARFRIPDIAVITGGRPAGGIIKRPPFLCIEILSPRDWMQEMQERIDDYLASGVRCVWLIHPQTRRAFVYTAEGMREAKDGILHTKDPEIAVRLSELD